MSTLKKYFVKRFFTISITLFIISLLVFGVTQILPGNSAKLMLGRYATPEAIEALNQQLGLNRPIYVQYLDWLTSFLTGDLGYSYVTNMPVADLVATRGIRSLQLATLSLLTVIITAIPLGVLAAVYRGKIDILITSITYIGVSMPVFVTGMIFILLFGGPIFNVLPPNGYIPPSEGILDWLRHLALPIITLAILFSAHIVRLSRADVLEELHKEYVRTAKLKGLSERRVILGHVLRNALLPTITILVIDFGYMIGSLVVVEEVFGIPGVGRLVVSSIMNRDIPTLQAIAILIATVYMVGNVVADLCYTYLDPRIDYE
jgi:peptide/nickel transport system permease protein